MDVNVDVGADVDANEYVDVCDGSLNADVGLS